MKRKLVNQAGLLAFVLSLCGASMAAAQDAEPSSAREGFVLRLSAGPGIAQSEIDDEGQNIKFSGVGADFNVAAGGVVADDVVIHATLAGWRLPAPAMELTHGPATFANDYDGSVQVTMLGAGVTAYFWDDFYLSPSLGLARLGASSDNGVDENSDVGAALDLTLGKEWRTSPSWSIGVAAALGLHYIRDANFDSDYRGGSVGVRFSATFSRGLAESVR